MFFGSKSLENILAGFSKTMTELEAFREASRQNAADKRFNATQLQAEADNHDKEADKADKVYQNILSLLGE